MKYAIILPDGAADEPVEQLDGSTPLAVARTPNLDWIAANGRIGTVRTIPQDMAPGSDVATLSVLGYSPRQCYTGRAPIEAAARRIALGPDDIVFRCNLVTVADGRMEDFSAGHIRSEEARRIMEDLNRQLGNERLCFHSGVSYRNLMVYRSAGDLDVTTTPPHDIHGQPVAKHLPAGRDAQALRDLMSRSQTILEEHEVNQVRRDLGENPATQIWLWGQGKMPRLATFQDLYGLRGALVAAVDLVRGIGMLIGWRIIDVPGATGYLDTDYAGKGQAAVQALDEHDLVAVHVEAPDEAGHSGDVRAKIAAIEQVDKHVVGPLLAKLRTFEQWRILAVPDHPTPVKIRTHTMVPPPFCMAGAGIPLGGATGFHEAAAEASGLKVDPGHELMGQLVKG